MNTQKNKKYFHFNVVLLELFNILIFLLMISRLSAQTQWEKYINNPVITKGPASWDIVAIGQPTVLFENDTIKMWYPGVGADFKARICYAFSTDGVVWTKHSNPVLDVGGAGEWDRGWMDTPEIVKDNTGYRLYYYGDTAWQFSAISSAIGVAYSADGINWTKDSNNPVFSKGTTGQWDDTWVESPALVFDSVNGNYKMWYNGMDTTTWKVQIGLATSMDGVVWVKHAGNPVLAAGSWGAYDDMWLGTPAVLYDGNIYEMWYSSTAATSYNVNTQAFDTVGICYATSTDGISWDKHSLNPLFNTFTLPYDSLLDTGGPWAADVVFNPNTQKYMMWFETHSGIMMAMAPKNNVITKDLIQRESLKIYPNPFTMSTSIEFEHSGNNAVALIYNSMGQLIKEKFIVNSNKFLLFRDGLKAGVYFLKIVEQNKTYIGRILIE